MFIDSASKKLYEITKLHPRGENTFFHLKTIHRYIDVTYRTLYTKQESKEFVP